MDELWWGKEDELFTDIYDYDTAILEKVQHLMDSPECLSLAERAITQGNALPLLDEVLADKKENPVKKLKLMLNPFYSRAEYKTKDDYLQYLKSAYGFMMSPLEEPPGRIMGMFFPKYKRSWSPSHNSAVELLTKFFVEVNLIEELSSREWRMVVHASNPEATLAKMLYGASFKPDFDEFLRKIPWILSWDVYSSPGLDLMYWTAPGQKLPKKPFGIGHGFLTNLATISKEKRAYVLLNTGNNQEEAGRMRLDDKNQILKQIEAEGTANLDTFVGLSKIERDFVIHQHIVIWKNPGYERYQRASLFNRIRFARPHPFLCVLREQALPLEIAFIERKFE
ncbi:MAG: hypothetical protein JSV56_03930 [Methanomassiliicoccales archaeon]|nr:MAG: hypothetical protein JSV56_03930 [Methanomassiliicoccales archaeon]